MTQWLSMLFDLTAKTAPACQKQTRRQTHRHRRGHTSSCYQDPDAFPVESALRACLAALKFRHSNPDALPLASLLRAFRAALKSVFKACLLGHAPGTKMSEILLPRACPKNFRNFMTASMPTKNFGSFITGSLSPSSYRNFRNFNTARFPKAAKISEISIPGKKCSRY